MIIGNGFLAKLLAPLDDTNLLIFVSGVSDPACISSIEFAREEDLLFFWLDKAPGRIFIYFGTTTPSDSLYAKHKRRMEDLVQKYAASWIIFRIGPVKRQDGLGNTFHDFARRRILNDQEFILYTGEVRPLLEAKDLYEFVTHWLKGPSINCCISFDGPWIPVEQIVSDLEIELNKKAKYRIK